MKVIKRDGRAVDYDRQKIATAINKANCEVIEKEKASKEDINQIIYYIESLGKKRMLVEDIQDIIEQKLMEQQKYDLAKKYIVYRYTRALVRKQNTTDESILGMIRNENLELRDGGGSKNTYLASAQRDYIAGEVSKDLTKRLLLPEKLSKADEKGILHFHHTDYYIQPIFNCASINIKDMLENGTVLNGIYIEPPKSFLVACTIVTQILAAVASNQYGGQSINISHLGKYLKKSYEKIQNHLKERYGSKMQPELIEEITKDKIKTELTSGIQTILYQANTLMTAKGNSPSVTLFLNIEENDEYVKENSLIIKEVLKQRSNGIINEIGENVIPPFPKFIYVLNENNNLTGGKYDDITKIAIDCATKQVPISFLSAKKMKENYGGTIYCPCGSRNFLPPWKDENGNVQFEGRFNQGMVTINLPQIAIIADGNEEKFWNELDERMELCKEALLCRHYTLLGTSSNISPIHWQYGAIARLQQDEKIDKYLKNGYSTLSLGYLGLSETIKLLKGQSLYEKEGFEFAIKLLNTMNQFINQWKKDTGLGFILCSTKSITASRLFAQKDRENFGTIKDVTDKDYYQNAYYTEKTTFDLKERLLLESKFQDLSLGGAISFISIDKKEKIETLLPWIYENIQFIKFK